MRVKQTLSAMVASIGKGIVVAPSNAAVANVAIKILTFGQFDVDSVVVFGDNCHESVQFLSPIHRYRHLVKFREKYWKLRGKSNPNKLLTEFADWLRLDNITTFRGTEDDLKEVLLLGFASWLRLPRGRATYQAIDEHCPRVDQSLKGQQKLQQTISRANVVLCTLNTAGSTFLRKSLHGKFNTLFLDEASQVRFGCCYFLLIAS